jgi:hypothetical protein
MRTFTMEFVGPRNGVNVLDRLIKKTLAQKFPEGSLGSRRTEIVNESESRTTYLLQFPDNFDIRSLEYALEFSLQEEGFYMHERLETWNMFKWFKGLATNFRNVFGGKHHG